MIGQLSLELLSISGGGRAPTRGYNYSPGNRNDEYELSPWMWTKLESADWRHFPRMVPSYDTLDGFDEVLNVIF